MSNQEDRPLMDANVGTYIVHWWTGKTWKVVERAMTPTGEAGYLIERQNPELKKLNDELNETQRRNFRYLSPPGWPAFCPEREIIKSRTTCVVTRNVVEMSERTEKPEDWEDK